MDLQDPIFIVGPGRSGTTLVRSIVSAHSQISVTPETQYLKWVDERWNVQGAPDDFESFWSVYTDWVRFQDLDIEADRCRQLLAETDHSFQSIFRAVLFAYAERAGARRVGEKSPSHIHYLATLFEWFPQAKVLIMLRDPRAVVASQLGTPYVRERIEPRSFRRGIFIAKRRREVIRYAEDWAHIFEDIAPKWKNHAQVHIVSYEDLVRDPEHQVRSICAFIEEDYEPAMLSNRTSSKVPSPAGTLSDKEFESWRRKHDAKSRAPISSASLGKWKDRLTSSETAIVEQRCRIGMRAYGYDLSLPKPTRYGASFLSHGYLGLHFLESQARKKAHTLRSHIRQFMK